MARVAGGGQMGQHGAHCSKLTVTLCHVWLTLECSWIFITSVGLGEGNLGCLPHVYQRVTSPWNSEMPTWACWLEGFAVEMAEQDFSSVSAAGGQGHV